MCQDGIAYIIMFTASLPNGSVILGLTAEGQFSLHTISTTNLEAKYNCGSWTTSFRAGITWSRNY
jgi:hypothetical protein